ncbi:leucine-rich repeat domain-containing protein [Metamycoplasma hominis]|nr:leucine-rich repeat domain-containing protein [Metamycoplasma hominis]
MISDISINSNNKNFEIKDNFFIDKNNKKILSYLDKKATKVTIPSSVKEIGESAFFDCKILKEVILNEGLEKIGARAFSNTNIKSITIPDTVKEIGNWAFDFSMISDISINSNNKNFEIEENFFIDKNNKKILSYLDWMATKVTIPSSIKEIGEGAFSGCENLKEVILNEGLEKIGAGAFHFSDISHISINSNNKNFEIEDNFFIDKNNKKILSYLDKKATKVTIPSSVKEIGEGAFSGCENLKEVTLNEGLEKIGAEAFYKTNIESITIPSSVKEIGERAFHGCTNLNEAILNEGLEKIGVEAFRYTKIGIITIPGSVKEIGNWAFDFWMTTLILINSNNKNFEIKDNFFIDKNNKKILSYLDWMATKVTIPSSIKEIGEGAFLGHGDLHEVILNEGLEKIGAWAFDFSIISHISINSNNKNFEIKDNFFIDKNNKKILAYLDKKATKVTIPGSVKEIDERAFSWCPNLKEVILNKGLEKIGAEAFYKTKIESITIPGSVKEIGEWAFYGCENLKEVILNKGLEKIGYSAFAGLININNPKIESITIPGSVKEIGAGAFSDCANLKKVILNEGLEKIGACAFSYTNIESITIPDTVKEIGESAFSGCTNLKEVILNEGLEKIGAKAFLDTNIESITIPGSVKEIGVRAFDFSRISHISINSNNKNFEIKDNFFIDKNNKKILAYLDEKATKVTIPGSVKEIGEWAFYGCKNLKEVILNKGLEKIGAWAFSDTKIESITIPGSVKEIGEDAFNGCTNLKEVILNEGLEGIGWYAFSNTNIESITIPGSIKEIDKYAFSWCESLKEVILNEGLEKIGAEAFAGKNIESITIPGSVKEIGERAFYNCKNLKEVIYKGDASKINWEYIGIDKTKIKIISSNN